MNQFENVAIVGPGLIGGSIGKGMRERGLAKRVIGIGRRESSLAKALEAGLIDESTLGVAEGVEEADLVVLATPIKALAAVAAPAAKAMKNDALLTDVASTKKSVIRTITLALRDRSDITYVPTHPMAGSEEKGPRAANGNLFQDSITIFTPLHSNTEGRLSPLKELWEGLGAKVKEMDPEAHDRLVARISHLPHIVAVELIEMLNEEELSFCGGGLIDTTRVASADPELWTDILKTNVRYIKDALSDYLFFLEEVRVLIEEGDFEKLKTLMKRAKEKRDELARRKRDFERNRQSAP